MQERQFSFEVEAGPEEVWAVLHPRIPPDPSGQRRVIEHEGVRIEIVHPGDGHGEGLVRSCTFRVPKYLLSGGVGRSWECVTEARPDELRSRYEAVGRPPWSYASGWHHLTELSPGRTRVSFGERYHAVNPLVRRLVERRVHDFITADNERIMRNAVESGLRAMRRRDHRTEAARD